MVPKGVLLGKKFFIFYFKKMTCLTQIPRLSENVTFCDKRKVFFENIRTTQKGQNTSQLFFFYVPKLVLTGTLPIEPSWRTQFFVSNVTAKLKILTSFDVECHLRGINKTGPSIDPCEALLKRDAIHSRSTIIDKKDLIS